VGVRASGFHRGNAASVSVRNAVARTEARAYVREMSADRPEGGPNALLRVEPVAAIGPEDVLLSRLRTGPAGLSERDALRRLTAVGPNELVRRRGAGWSRALLAQFVHPLALLLAAAAALAAIVGLAVLAAAIVAVILVNALLAFWQERQAEHAVEALRRYLPPHATVVRDGQRRIVEAVCLVPGDVMLVSDGDRISADTRLLEGAVEVDMSALTGESQPVLRSANLRDRGVGLLEARDVVFSGTSTVAGEARAVVFATGMQTELSRVAALSQRVEREESPLQQQIRRVAWLIALIAVIAGAAFVPIGTLLTGLPLSDAVIFAIGLLVANVPEGLLPTITLALAVGVRQLARRGALVKRLTGVETLGSTNVVCTDKTGTLTENRMRVAEVWTPFRCVDAGDPLRAGSDGGISALTEALAACNNATLDPAGEPSGDPTEVGLLRAASAAGVTVDPEPRSRNRRRLFAFDPALKLMTMVDDRAGQLWAQVKGAADVLLKRSTSVLADGSERDLDAAAREHVEAGLERFARRGLRVMGVARRLVERIPGSEQRDETERNLCRLGLVALLDPPRPEVVPAVADCHRAGIRIHVTGDHGLTASEIARQVGIQAERIVAGGELDRMNERELDALLESGDELVFARGSPEAKLTDRVCPPRSRPRRRDDGRRRQRRAGAASRRRRRREGPVGHRGRPRGGHLGPHRRQLRDDRRCCAGGTARLREHPQVRPLHLRPRTGGRRSPPRLRVQRTPGAPPAHRRADPRHRPGDRDASRARAWPRGVRAGDHGATPRRREEGVVTRALLYRAWLFLGLLASVLVLAGFLFVLLRAGWSPGESTSSGTPLHDAYLRATAMTFAGIVACQVGTAFASRTERASLRAVGVFTNRLLLAGIVFELAFAAAIVYVTVLQAPFGTRSLGPAELAFIAPFQSSPGPPTSSVGGRPGDGSSPRSSPQRVPRRRDEGSAHREPDASGDARNMALRIPHSNGE
jgi:magnesium-transporting ATPase (P-type)